MSRRELERRLRVWQSRLKLDHWQIRLNLDEPVQTEGSTAEIGKTWDYDRAEIRLARGWRSWNVGQPIDETGETVDGALVHELLHIHLRELHWTHHKLMDGHLHRDAAALSDDAYNHAEEGLIDRLSRVLVEAWGSP
jgi:hypothetical protein